MATIHPKLGWLEENCRKPSTSWQLHNRLVCGISPGTPSTLQPKSVIYLPWVYPWFTPHPSEMSSEIDGHREQNNALTCRTSDWLIGYNHWRHKRSLPGGHESKVVPLSTNFSTALYVLGFISSYETNSKCLKKSLLGERPPLKQPIRHAQAHAFQKNLLGKETRMIWSGCWFPILSEKYPMLNCHITNWKITMFNGDFPVCYVTVYQAG